MRSRNGKAALLLVGVLLAAPAWPQDDLLAPQRLIWHLTAPARDRLGRVIRSKLGELRKVARELKERYPNITPDEVDWRSDFHYFEVGFDPFKDDGSLTVTELTLKHPDSGFEVSIGLEGDWDDPDWNGRIRLGHAVEFRGKELKWGVTLDVKQGLDDLYDGQWQKRSEWAIIDGVERLLAPFNFYVGGAAGAGDQVNTGIEVSYSLRDRVTDLAFAPMREGFERLADAQAYYAQWRLKKLADEARRLGIDPTGKPFNQLMHEIKARYDADPSQQRPLFHKNPSSVGVKVMLWDWYCTNRPWITMALMLPDLIHKGGPQLLEEIGRALTPPGRDKP